MSNPNKAKGTRFESDVVDFLRKEGLTDARRVVQTGRLDSGDIHVGGWALQAKAWKSLTDALREGVDGAMRQHAVAGLPWGAAVIKRPRKNVKEAYVVLPLKHFARLLKGLAAAGLYPATSRALEPSA